MRIYIVEVKEGMLELMSKLCVCRYSYNLNMLLQQQQKLTEPYEQSAAYLRYTQEATEVIKNAVGVCNPSHNMPFFVILSTSVCPCDQIFISLILK